MVDSAKKKESHWWWFVSHKNTKRSPWLQSTIEELDARAKAMLRIIEDDADSFAKRAEMFYNKKPELIRLVEDFYRAHRSLAERYDLAKSEPVMCPMPSPLAYSKSRSEKDADLPCDTYSISSVSEDLVESEIDEADQPEKQLDDSNSTVMQLQSAELERLKGEIEKLKEENKNQKIELLQKDEDKREVIRQLSMAIDMLKEDNTSLRQRVVSASKDPRCRQPKSTYRRIENPSALFYVPRM